MLTLGSLFDGIGGWLLAAQHAGIEPIWASEIAPFPASVTAHHFPNVVQLGDITGIQDLPPVDIVTCGSPCQDLSVAGKRKGLSGERSGLFIRAVELVRRLRMSTGGEIPKIFCLGERARSFQQQSRNGLSSRARRDRRDRNSNA